MTNVAVGRVAPCAPSRGPEYSRQRNAGPSVSRFNLVHEMCPIDARCLRRKSTCLSGAVAQLDRASDYGSEG